MLESVVEERWERYLEEGVLETPDFLYSILGQRRVHAPSVI